MPWSPSGVACSIIDGAFYGPPTPQVVIDAALDFGQRRIDQDTYRGGPEERWHYLARPKAKPDAEGHVRLRVACGPTWRPTPRHRVANGA
jgi:hypothetical protein